MKFKNVKYVKKIFFINEIDLPEWARFLCNFTEFFAYKLSVYNGSYIPRLYRP